ncbi:Leucine Rich Repeat [Carpediemonas membranifera]|uniref:Leucine Rich Repeat n=1 Tax=Carpediemonas membranifera TaxID=201153 RepID=A0A8J6E6U6_9EUKA|nr:Leucine Rich Repeat [Carpediemonas membranifera]|eukprot:KAG9389935.1 Leucine Rich Repeat [Carpediemonas membranifera]
MFACNHASESLLDPDQQKVWSRGFHGNDLGITSANEIEENIDDFSDDDTPPAAQRPVIRHDALYHSGWIDYDLRIRSKMTKRAFGTIQADSLVLYRSEACDKAIMRLPLPGAMVGRVSDTIELTLDPTVSTVQTICLQSDPDALAGWYSALRSKIAEMEYRNNVVGLKAVESATECHPKVLDFLKNELTSFSLKDDRLNIVDLEALARSFAVSQRITKIELTSVEVGEIGCQIIADMMQQNGTVVDLTLSNCGVSRTAVSMLGKAIQSHPTLTRLDLNHNDLQEGGMELMLSLTTSDSPPPLSYLDVSYCSMGTGTVAGLINSLQAKTLPVVSLVLAGNSMDATTVMILANCLGSVPLRRLDLSHCGLTPDHIITISTRLPDSKLEHLAISKNTLNTEAAIMFIDSVSSTPSLNSIVLDSMAGWSADAVVYISQLVGKWAVEEIVFGSES